MLFAFLMPPFPVIFANAIESAISIAVVVIAFIGWIVQIAGSNKTTKPNAMPQRPPQRKRAKQSETLQNEIDSFLNEVGGKRRTNPHESAARERSTSASQTKEPWTATTARRSDNLGTYEGDNRASATVPTAAPSRPAAFERPARKADVEARPAGPPIAAPPLPVPAGVASEWDREQQRRREEVLGPLTAHHLQSSQLGRELREHVSQFLAESQQIQADKLKVDQELATVRAELRRLQRQQPGNGTGVYGATTEKVTRTGIYAAVLRDKNTVKTAFVAAEIFAKPKGLKARRFR